MSICLNKIDSGLFVEIKTARLKIISVSTTEYESQLIALYGDKDVNALVGTGATLEAALVKDKIQRWIARWSANNPFSGYVVLEKSTGDFVGQIILKPVKDKSTTPPTFIRGTAEIGFLSRKEHWGKGYGKEFTNAIVNHLAPMLINDRFLVGNHEFHTLIATAGCNNAASNRVLSLFMQCTGEKERYGSLRIWYQKKYD